MAAALSAARAGSPVLLLEAAPQLGGTVVHALIHTLAGLYDTRGELLSDGLPRELAERLHAADPRTRQRKMGRAWVLSVCPDVYRRTVTRWIAEHPEIAVRCAALVTRVRRSGPRITELEIAADGTSLRLPTAAVIDATGTAEVVRLTGQSLVEDDGPRAAGGWIVRLRRVAPGALDFPKGLAVVRALRAAAQTGGLPWECRHAWIDCGIDPDEAFLKLFVPLGERWRERRGEISRAAEATTQAVVELLRDWPDFTRSEVHDAGSLGVRDGGRIRGRYTLTADDVRQSRRFPDAVCRAAWPIEYWDPERGVTIEYLPAGAHYEIPMRSLQLPAIDNLWAVGKCLSADRLAHASARVVGTCWAMGQAAGLAAATAVQSQEESSRQEHRGEPVPAVP
jgi:hypothetical protein